MTNLSQAAREEVVLALILWKDFKAQGANAADSIKVSYSAIRLAQELGVIMEYDALLSKMPLMKIEPR